MAANQLNILLSPLNWGLGHASRCVPIIQALNLLGHHVILASDGNAYHFLQQEFPDLLCLPLPNLNIRYPSKSLTLNMFSQSYKFWRSFQKDLRACDRIIREYDIDLVISDNRYGIVTEKCHSIFISHQINIIGPNRLLQNLINVWNAKRIRKYDRLWIPDLKGINNLSGSLSHDIDFEAQYLGILSRLKPQTIQEDIDLFIILSGPEPQRSILEKQILMQWEHLPKNTVLVRGLPKQSPFEIEQVNKGEVYPFLKRDELNHMLNRSKVVLCRSGYTSVMDLAILQKKCIFIPTPGQTEQEYLANSLSKKGYCISRAQNRLNIMEDYEQVSDIKGFPKNLHKYEPLIEIIESELKQIMDR